MAAVLSSAALVTFMDAIRTDILLGNVEVGLYVNENIVPTIDTTVDDYTEPASLAWYQRLEPTTVNQVANAPGGGYKLVCSSVTWDWTAYGSLNDTIYGYFVARVDDGTLLFSEALDEPVIMDSLTSQITVLPTLTIRDQDGN